MVEEKKTENKIEREYIIPLRKSINKVPRYKRANKAVKTVKEFVAKHMKVADRDLNKVRIERYLNEFIWSRGIKKPPVKVKVKVSMNEGIARVELVEMSQHMKFKKEKIERRGQKALETAKTKEKKTETPVVEEKTEEEKKETDEKKASVVEAGQKMEKTAAKTMKHQSKITKKQTQPRRMALQK